MNDSVSAKALILEIKGKAKIACLLKRHLSPKTVGMINRSLPLEGRVHKLGASIVYFETPINSGTERARTMFEKDDVAFLPSSQSICFFTKSTEFGKTMTPIGKLKGDTSSLNDIVTGDVFCLYEGVI